MFWGVPVPAVSNFMKDLCDEKLHCQKISCPDLKTERIMLIFFGGNQCVSILFWKVST